MPTAASEIAGDADRGERMVAELADHHLGGQEHRELGEIGDRQRNGDDGELAELVLESGIGCLHEPGSDESRNVRY